jgi:hypothetical protein
MSTRALYSFSDGGNAPVLNVFKHHDSYPSGAADVLHDALKLAWPLPRFEADEFAGAFIAAGKDGTPGGMRLAPSGVWQDCGYADIEYHYDITKGAAEPNITASIVSCNWDTGEWTVQHIFAGTLSDFIARASELDEIEASF